MLKTEMLKCGKRRVCTRFHLERQLPVARPQKDVGLILIRLLAIPEPGDDILFIRQCGKAVYPDSAA